MSTTKVPKSSVTYVCQPCDYTTCRKSQYTRHLSTAKHQTNCFSTNSNNLVPKSSKPLICTNCNKGYKERTGLWYHQQKCFPPIVANTDASNNFVIDKELVMSILKLNTDIIKENSELKNLMMEVIKNGTHTTNNTNSHNKTFNLQFFLHETCKDAMNIMDFVNTMTLEFSDLEEVGKVGYVEGISNIIIRKLNALDINKRPIHCSDAKREIMYVKDENIWEKENSTYDKLRKAIKHVTCKNSAMLEPWSKANPLCMNTSHRLNDVYVQMIGQSMGGKESFLDSENKIMKKSAKAVLIDKALL
jgi:hypothetical protein